MKITEVLDLLMAAGEFAQGLGHEPGLGAHLGVPHIAFDFGPGHQGRHRIHDHDVDGVGAHQDLGDFQGLFPGVRLGNEQILGFNPQLPGIVEIQSMFGVDEGRHARPCSGPRQ